ncbi:MAG: hypothetical protein G01um10148_816 [Parcubacteria group bacterium Gr01-1014_8]|nr:MAG: hypothetical protein G01um10148_816 [Parcubacteria group bacterium Gr01-1014_8]
MQSIPEMTGSIKGYVDKGTGEWGIPVIVILVGIASFGLGRLSTLEGSTSAVSVSSIPMQAASASLAVGGLVVASRTGTAYHYPWCAGATTIKESNKVWFKDEEAARKAGYTPAKNCRGLK